MKTHNTFAIQVDAAGKFVCNSISEEKWLFVFEGDDLQLKSVEGSVEVTVDIKDQGGASTSALVGQKSVQLKPGREEVLKVTATGAHLGASVEHFYKLVVNGSEFLVYVNTIPVDGKLLWLPDASLTQCLRRGANLYFYFKRNQSPVFAFDEKKAPCDLFMSNMLRLSDEKVPMIVSRFRLNAKDEEKYLLSVSPNPGNVTGGGGGGKGPTGGSTIVITVSG